MLGVRQKCELIEQSRITRDFNAFNSRQPRQQEGEIHRGRSWGRPHREGSLHSRKEYAKTTSAFNVALLGCPVWIVVCSSLLGEASSRIRRSFTRVRNRAISKRIAGLRRDPSLRLKDGSVRDDPSEKTIFKPTAPASCSRAFPGSFPIH